MNAPLLGHLSPGMKLLFFMLLVLTCFILFSLLSFLLVIPFFHFNLFRDITLLTDYNNPDTTPVLKFLQIVQTTGLFFIPALLAGFFFGGNIPDYTGMKKIQPGIILFPVLFIMFTFLPAINWITTINEQMKLPAALHEIEKWMSDTEKHTSELTDLFLNASTIGGLLVNLLMIAVLPALGEEFFFRGILQRLFSEWFRNIHIAIILTGFLFGLIHLQFYGILPRVLLGILFGYFYYWTKSIWAPVLAHFLNNGAAVIISFLTNRGLISTHYQDVGTTDNFFLITGSFLLTFGLLFWVYRYSRRKLYHLPGL